MESNQDTLYHKSNARRLGLTLIPKVVMTETFETDLKESLEIRRPIHNNYFSKNKCENIKAPADSKFHLNILYQLTLLVFSPKPLIAKS